MSVKVVDIYPAAARLGKYPPLFTSTSVNNNVVNINVVFQISSALLSISFRSIFGIISKFFFPFLMQCQLIKHVSR